MTQHEYILSCAGLPFYLDANDADADALFNAVPRSLMNKWSAAGHNHQEAVMAGDDISEWMSNNWRSVLPELSAKFPINGALQPGAKNIGVIASAA